MKIPIAVILAALLAQSVFGAGVCILVHDVSAPSVVASTHAWSISNYPGAVSLRVVWGYTPADVNSTDNSLSCVLPCDATMDTTATIYYKLQSLDSGGTVIFTGPVTTF